MAGSTSPTLMWKNMSTMRYKVMRDEEMVLRNAVREALVEVWIWVFIFLAESRKWRFELDHSRKVPRIQRSSSKKQNREW